jgi:hypothetical protein
MKAHTLADWLIDRLLQTLFNHQSINQPIDQWRKPFGRNRTADTRQPREKMRQHQGFSGSPRIRTWTMAGLSRFPLPIGAASRIVAQWLIRDLNLDCGGSRPLLSAGWSNEPIRKQ